MSNVEASIEVDMPVTKTYDRWTQFESFPEFMEGIKEVRQLTDTELWFKGEIGGVEREWHARILEQVPDQIIRWESIGGPRNGGVVRFTPLGVDRTRVTVNMYYTPESFMEKAGDAVGAFEARVKADLKRFKKSAERSPPMSGWRGEVHAGRRTS
jgi:uncharacterized membrane protein